MNSRLLQEIEDLNLTYLLLARRLLEEDFPSGLFRLGISKPEGERFLALTTKQISHLSRTNQLVFTLRLRIDHLDMESPLDRRDVSSLPNLTAIRLASEENDQI
ncbi:flagellar transcriptional regulator FlhD [Porticoccus sp.]